MFYSMNSWHVLWVPGTMPTVKDYRTLEKIVALLKKDAAETERIRKRAKKPEETP